MLPHWGNLAHKDDYFNMLDVAYTQNIPLLSLTDTQAVEIDGGKLKIIIEW